FLEFGVPAFGEDASASQVNHAVTLGEFVLPRAGLRRVAGDHSDILPDFLPGIRLPRQHNNLVAALPQPANQPLSNQASAACDKHAHQGLLKRSFSVKSYCRTAKSLCGQPQQVGVVRSQTRGYEGRRGTIFCARVGDTQMFTNSKPWWMRSSALGLV